jgi:hypothetical protein
MLEVQVIQSRHIAESDEAAMSRMEAAMAASQTAAGKALNAAKARRNSNVRSLALSLGKKRTVTAECDDMLQALEDALAQHHFSATR